MKHAVAVTTYFLLVLKSTMILADFFSLPTIEEKYNSRQYHPRVTEDSTISTKRQYVYLKDCSPHSTAQKIFATNLCSFTGLNLDMNLGNPNTGGFYSLLTHKENKDSTHKLEWKLYSDPDCTDFIDYYGDYTFSEKCGDDDKNVEILISDSLIEPTEPGHFEK